MMSYFQHNRCGQTVYVNIAESIRFLVSYGLGKNVLRIGTGDIQTDKDVFDVEFYCTSCATNVRHEDVEARCGNCGDVHPLDELFKPSESGGMYCERCAATYKAAGESLKKVSSMAQRISLRNV